MKTIKNSKELTTLEVDDVVVFGDLEYKVYGLRVSKPVYFLATSEHTNSIIFNKLKLNKLEFCSNLGIEVNTIGDFPETKSLEALTAIVSALFKEYEKQNEFPKTWEEFCERNKMGDKKFCLYDGVIIGTGISKNTVRDTVLIESAEEAQAFRALMQLRQLRKAYVKDWEPNWNDVDSKFCINFRCEEVKVTQWSSVAHPLSFPTIELATQFLNNFKDLIEIAKPLL